MMDFITHNALLLSLLRNVLCNLCSHGHDPRLWHHLPPWYEAGCRHRKISPWSVCLRRGPIRSPALWAAAQRSKVRWWTLKRTHGGAGCGPAGGREGRSEPQWLPPPKPAASAPSSCPSCDIRGSDIIKHNPSERRERKGVHKHLQKKSLKNF